MKVLEYLLLYPYCFNNKESFFAYELERDICICSVNSFGCGKPKYQKCHSGFISESICFNMLRDPETSSGWQSSVFATESN